jgi:hypothetical protein
MRECGKGGRKKSHVKMKKEKKLSPQQSGFAGKIQKILSPWLEDPLWIPDSMNTCLQCKGETLFATRDLPVIPQHTEVYVKESIHWRTNNYLIVGVMPGADQNKEFIYYLLRKPIALFLQRPWAQEEVAGAQRLIETFVNLSLEATGLGLLGPRDLFILMDSTSAGTRWSHVPPETEFADVVWQIGENPVDEALDFLNPEWLSACEDFVNH